MKKDSIFTINTKATQLVKSIRLLDKITWPKEVEREFFRQLKKGNRAAIKFNYPQFDFSTNKSELLKLVGQLSSDNPLHIHTKVTIESYCKSIDMIHSVGTVEFQNLSIEEYGKPTHLLFGSKYSHLETAKKFIKSFEDYEHGKYEVPPEIYSARDLKQFLEKRAVKTLGEYAPKITISYDMSAKVSAGKSRVRIRQNTHFSQDECDQLLVHEILVHSLTAINGSLQTQLPLLAMGAPRTTKTQEGLATFSEIITGSLDLSRLKRISLRVIALEMALEGANFYEVFDFFLRNGQSEKESYLSSARIFRGGNAEGGIAFTKDGVYLEGLFRVHSFFRWAFKTKNLDLVPLLFCGRLDINDIFLLKSSYESGLIQKPRFLPEWYQNIDLLAGKMAFSVMLSGIDLEAVERHFTSKIS